MSTEEIAAVYDSALALPEQKRAELANRLLDSLAEPAAGGAFSPEIAAEVRRRSQEIERGEVELVPWSEVRAAIHQRLGRRDQP
ncbi:MAG: addiction module protein [Planctomycetota bacterium]